MSPMGAVQTMSHGTCALPGCPYGRRVEGSKIHAYCSRTCAQKHGQMQSSFHAQKIASANQAGKLHMLSSQSFYHLGNIFLMKRQWQGPPQLDSQWLPNHQAAGHKLVSNNHRLLLGSPQQEEEEHQLSRCARTVMPSLPTQGGVGVRPATEHSSSNFRDPN